jgi:hypothetical protein
MTEQRLVAVEERVADLRERLGLWEGVFTTWKDANTACVNGLQVQVAELTTCAKGMKETLKEFRTLHTQLFVGDGQPAIIPQVTSNSKAIEEHTKAHARHTGWWVQLVIGIVVVLWNVAITTAWVRQTGRSDNRPVPVATGK